MPVQSTGAVNLFLGYPKPYTAYQKGIDPLSSQTIVWLGAGSTGPDIDETGFWEPLISDISGTRTPFDQVFEGCSATIAIQLTNWSESALNILQNRPYTFTSGPRGSYAATDVGTCALSEHRALSVYALFTRRNAPAMVANNMPRGFRAPANVVAAEVTRKSGSRANSVGVVMLAIARYIASTATFVVYDHNVAAVEAITPDL